jgi:hypothetical protein
VRGYLVALLAQLWREGQGFSGKRPFGTSAWQHDLLDPLIKQGLISGKFDEYGFVEEMDQEAGNRLIAMAIEALDID